MTEMTLCGVILAGGKSSRMGSPKELLDWQGRPLLLHLVEGILAAGLPCLAISNTPDRLPLQHLRETGVRITSDIGKSCGPISGIYTAFQYCQEDALLVLSCDLPFLKPDDIKQLASFVGHLQDWDAVLTESQGRAHPLLALYHRRTLPVWENALRQQNYKVMDAINRLKVKYIPEGLLGEMASYNMNTPDQYRFACEQRRQNNAFSTGDIDGRGRRP